ncbi:MAG: histidine triad nucleotide-binding protein [Gammaproteobacteria bacterium]|nr:histidine triad nucleotide-binding protein [Gammaproteobacteria bacterium]
MSDCLFCKVVEGSLPSEKVYEDDQIVVFKDIYPKADVHLLIIPRQHIASLNELDETHDQLIASMFRLLPKIARQQGLDNGFRTIINTGPGGGQEVYHLHIHLLGGGNLLGFA